MSDAINITNLSKKYNDFELKNVSFNVPQGSIMGFIGENGAGKSTTIKLILDLARKDGGDIKIYGKDLDDDLKEQIGVVMDECNFPAALTVADMGKIFKNCYKSWQSETYKKYIEKFKLPLKKMIKDYSKGMKMKLSIAAALSHNPKLLILDEATSGLDPIVRDEILEEFLNFIQDPTHSILISSHIVSDLEKICDYITFIHNGKIIFSENKDDLLEEYSIIKCDIKELNNIPKENIIGKRVGTFASEALVKNENVPQGVLSEKASIEDIMLFYVRGEKL